MSSVTHVGESRFRALLEHHFGFLLDVGLSEPVFDQTGDRRIATFVGDDFNVVVELWEASDFMGVFVAEAARDDPAHWLATSSSHTGRAWDAERLDRVTAEHATDLRERISSYEDFKSFAWEYTR